MNDFTMEEIEARTDKILRLQDENKELNKAYYELKEKYELLINDKLNHDAIKALMNRSLKYKAQADKLAEKMEYMLKNECSNCMRQGIADKALKQYRYEY